MKIQTIKESGCLFEFYCDAYIQLDRFKDYRQINYLGLKAVDLVFSNKDEIYFVEIKCYEYFTEFLDSQESEKVQVLVRKLIDSIFFLGIVKTNDVDLRKLRSALFRVLNMAGKILFVVIICPICSGGRNRVEPDRVVVISEVLKRRLKALERVSHLLIVIDSYHNKLGIFNDVKKV